MLQHPAAAFNIHAYSFGLHTDNNQHPIQLHPALTRSCSLDVLGLIHAASNGPAAWLHPSEKINVGFTVSHLSSFIYPTSSIFTDLAGSVSAQQQPMEFKCLSCRALLHEGKKPSLEGEAWKNRTMFALMEFG